ncbi:MAG: GxxExxY protein [Alphaproteobacteria bacterium]|nr:GxxExxY protein [Alphaproteobacteria bacterium]
MLLSREQIVGAVIRASYQIHAVMGTQQTHEDYVEALANHLTDLGIAVARHVPVLLPYDGRYADTGHHIDLVIDRKIAINVASSSPLTEEQHIDFASHVQFGGHEAGFLLDFRVTYMAQGVHTVKRR